MSDPRVQSSRGECEITVRRGGLAELGAGVRRVAPNAKTVMLAEFTSGTGSSGVKFGRPKASGLPMPVTTATYCLPSTE